MTNNKLSKQEVKEMLDKLSKHFEEPVMPVSKYCNAISTWFRCIENNYQEQLILFKENNIHESEFIDFPWAPHLQNIETAIRKSNLLFRLIYAGEELRTEKCPIHQGHWSGCKENACELCSCGYDVTGWLRK